MTHTSIYYWDKIFRRCQPAHFCTPNPWKKLAVFMLLMAEKRSSLSCNSNDIHCTVYAKTKKTLIVINCINFTSVFTQLQKHISYIIIFQHRNQYCFQITYNTRVGVRSVIQQQLQLISQGNRWATLHWEKHISIFCVVHVALISKTCNAQVTCQRKPCLRLKCY